MEFYPKDDLDLSFEKVNGESEIQNVYSGTHIFITGSTGFMGKILLEKLLRTCNPAQVFILVRQKRGKTQAERLEDLLNDVVFERMLIENKKAREKIILMNGDCSLPNLGLSEDDTKILQNKIDFIFHCAATVNMGEHLRTAFNINVNATRSLLEQAKTMTKLKAFIYVSTAYTQVMLSKIEEKFYPTEFSAEELDQLVNSLDDVQLSALTPILVGNRVNTYSLTKAVTEYMVSKYYPELPVAVVRPSIVISTALEPIAGWIDNIYGATGVNAGAYSGLLRVWRTDPKVVADLIPVDITINEILAIGWHIGIRKPISENKFLSAYRKVYKANVAISPYCIKEFKYKDDNVDKVWALMNAKDKLLFNFDMNVYTYEEYFRYYTRGIRVYLLKDPMETIPIAVKRYKLLYYFALVSKSLVFLFGGLLVYYVTFNFVPFIN